jgi:hypothetical protein
MQDLRQEEVEEKKKRDRLQEEQFITMLLECARITEETPYRYGHAAFLYFCIDLI